jgi:protein required for attachment to host cells
MNMNSLVIVADASRARLFRTAATNVAEPTIELIEIDSLNAAEPPDQAPRQDELAANGEAENVPSESLRRFADRIAIHTAQFAHGHFCNPFIVVSDQPVSAAILAGLARELPNVHVRRVTADVAQMPPRELMQELQQRAVFTPLTARTPGRIEL